MNYPIYVDGSIPVEQLIGLFANAGMRLRCNLKSEMVVEPRPIPESPPQGEPHG